jgi:methyl-accepting chemotaxis protein
MLQSIRTMMALIVGVVVLIVQSLLIYIVVSSMYAKTVDISENQMDLMVSTLAKSATDFGIQQMELVRALAKIPSVQEVLKQQLPPEATTPIVSSFSMASEAINTIYIFDNQGKQVFIMQHGKVGKPNDLSSREYIQAAMAGKEGYSSAPTKSLATGKLIVSVTTPVTDASGKVLGGIGMSYSLDQFITSFIETTRIGKTGYPLIISPKGVVVAHPDASLLLKDLSTEPGIRDMLRAPKGEGSFTQNGTEKMISWTQVPQWNWVLGFVMNSDEVAATAKTQRNSMLLLGGLAILVLIAVTLLALDRIAVRPLKQLEQYASAVASGNLNSSLGLRLQNEIGKLADSLRTMVGSLEKKIAEADEKTRDANEATAQAAKARQDAEAAQAAAESAKTEGMLQAAQQLEGVVEIVSSASAQLSAQIEQSSQGAQEQSRRVGETATSMEEMRATVLEVARNAEQAATSADNAKTKAQDGATLVTKVVNGIRDAQEHALGLKTEMTSLGQQAEGIGQVLNVISDIADQTNLLALNAAIEAARAGEAGRGFAVVADEVRKLAEKTMTATTEVGQAIQGIQNGTKNNIGNVQKVVETIDTATNLAGQSGDALQEIVALVERSSEQVRSIATASEEQSAATEEISRSVEAVNTISSDLSDTMQQSSQAVTELAGQAQVLKGLIDDMRDDSTAQSRPHRALPSA